MNKLEKMAGTFLWRELDSSLNESLPELLLGWSIDPFWSELDESFEDSLWYSLRRLLLSSLKEKHD